MKTLEIIQLASDGQACRVRCRLHSDDAAIRSIEIPADKQTYANLQAVIERYPGCRYRLSPVFEPAGHLLMKGTVSVVHVRWIRRIAFIGSLDFSENVRAALQEGKNGSLEPSGEPVCSLELPGQSDRTGFRLPQGLPNGEGSAAPANKHGRGYIRGLDGLRAIAVLFVVAYHFWAASVPGGFLGVAMFFVLSGYLITDLLAAQWNRHQTIDLLSFWGRRARRLLPALIVMLAAVSLFVAAFAPDHGDRLEGDALAALLFFSNWRFIWQDVSYFDSFGPPAVLGHTWSLAVEEQFYVLWPIILTAGLRWVRSAAALSLLALAAAGVSAMLMAAWHEPGYDPSRIYYGTDTRAFSLLIGAALALACPSANALRPVLPWKSNAASFAGLVGLAGIFWMAWRVNEFDDWLYPWGMVALSGLTALLIASLVLSRGWLARIMNCAPLAWIGKRSYGIYLWHFPIMVLMNPGAAADGSKNGLFVICQLAAVFVLADLSWRWIEKPIIHQSYRAAIRSLSVFPWRKLIIGAASLTILLFAGANCEFKRSVPVAEDVLASAAERYPAVPLSQPMPAFTFHPETSEMSQAVYAPVPRNDPGEMEEPVRNSSGLPTVTVIGDSVVLGAKPALEEQLPGIQIDGQIGRQMRDLADVIRQRKEEGQLGDIVVIALGTNGAFPQKQLLSVIDALGEDRRLFLVNVRIPRPWEKIVNERLSDAAGQYSNVELIDWHSESEGKDHFFGKDGVHLTRTGAKHYAELIARSIEAVQNEKEASTP